MSAYIRFRQPGGYYFFTLVTYKRRQLFADSRNVEILKSAIHKVKSKYSFSLYAMVILPDHLHCILKLPENDSDFSTRLRLIKRNFSMMLNAPVNQRKEKEIWQRRFWEHVIRDEEDWKRHMDYIHYNPVKHGLVESPVNWVHSSFDYWVKKGVYDKSWGSNEIRFSRMDCVE